ncbi:hypothetical protein LSTR_LSTR005028 [Laodelphax striatellus]|uniref:Uncharacterized protein n=1 Tax=Laodelphax striatellus TaxID=195883 RepID=A0A482WSX4_LAOST|nr:hypothetical protein LSTR_LSTR005028 [Laodelphax striatellus]
MFIFGAHAPDLPHSSSLLKPAAPLERYYFPNLLSKTRQQVYSDNNKHRDLPRFSPSAVTWPVASCEFTWGEKRLSGANCSNQKNQLAGFQIALKIADLGRTVSVADKNDPKWRFPILQLPYVNVGTKSKFPAALQKQSSTMEGRGCLATNLRRYCVATYARQRASTEPRVSQSSSVSHAVTCLLLSLLLSASLQCRSCFVRLNLFEHVRFTLDITSLNSSFVRSNVVLSVKFTVFSDF